MMHCIKRGNGDIARSKVKELRAALRQGIVESEFFVQNKGIEDILFYGFEAAYRNDKELFGAYKDIVNNKFVMSKEVFAQSGDVKRSLFFDAIEMIDHYEEMNGGGN